MAAPEPPADDIFQADGYLRSELFDDAALAAVRESLEQARQTRWDSVRSPHVFMGLLAVPDAGVCAWGKQLNEELSTILEHFQELFRQDDAQADAVVALHREFLSDNVIRLLRDAQKRALGHSRSRITAMDLLITVLTSENSIVAECFESSGITAARLTELAVIAEHLARPA